MLKAKNNLIIFKGKPVAICNTSKEAKNIVKSLLTKSEKEIQKLEVHYNHYVRRYVLEAFNGQWWESEITDQLLEEIEAI